MPNSFSPAVTVLLRRALPFALFALTPLGAQTAPAPAAAAATSNTTAAAAPSTSFNLLGDTLYEHIFSAHLNSGGSGSLSTDRFVIGAQHTMDWEADHLQLGVGYSYEIYDFSGTPAPFGNVQKLGASVFYTHDINPDWGAFGYLEAGLSAETAASLGDGGQLALAAGPTYHFSKVLSVSAGPMYYSRIEDEDTWTLMVRANWDFLPQWELRAYAGIANGATVSYDIFGNQATVAEASLEYNSRWFRIQDQAGTKRSVNESDGTFKIGVRQALNNNFFVRGYVAYVFSREYQLHVNGNSANSFNVDSSWGLGLEFGARF